MKITIKRRDGSTKEIECKPVNKNKVSLSFNDHYPSLMDTQPERHTFDIPIAKQTILTIMENCLNFELGDSK